MSEAKSDNYRPSSPHEAEETVDAIHQGSVDAVVVRGPDGLQVVMLQGAEEPYRVLAERMSDGAVTLASDGTILYANSRLGDMAGVAAKELVGRSFAALFKGDPPTLVPASVTEGRLERDGDALPVSVWTQPLIIGKTTATLVTLTDLTVHRRAAETAVAERFARSILEQATDAIVILSPDAQISHASLMAEGLAASPPVGLQFSEAYQLEALNPAQSGVLSRFSAQSLDVALATKPFHGVEVRLRNPQHAERAFLLSTGPLLNDEREPVGSIVTLTDITERKRAEEQQTTLVAELNHRVKNILAIVQSIAAQTVRSAGSLDNFNDKFSGRLKALSIAHDILTQTRWIGIGFNELLEVVLAPYRSGEQRIHIQGPPVMLPARALLPLSMVLHEMTTNAIKYGALSARDGQIDIEWGRTGNAANEVELTWIERGGPKVERRTASGFGTKLIERVVSYDLDGATQFDYDPTGVRCKVTFPLELEGRLPAQTPGAH